ncbi:MAG: hypothetical protein ISS16_09870 [Ignavibacteria bacterium]|nr:hypothetical protein [Ignavibacteria bacterium]
MNYHTASKVQSNTYSSDYPEGIDIHKSEPVKDTRYYEYKKIRLQITDGPF